MGWKCWYGRLSAVSIRKIEGGGVLFYGIQWSLYEKLTVGKCWFQCFNFFWKRPRGGLKNMVGSRVGRGCYIRKRYVCW